MKEWIMIHKIKALHNDGNGLSMRAISRELDLSRNTVKKYLQMTPEEIQSYESHSRLKRLDNQRDYIIHLLETYPLLSAVKVLRKLKEKTPDLRVSNRSARRYISQIKETVSLKQKRYYEPIIEMVPGVQCQVDGGELRNMMIGGIESVIYFVVFVLSYSRMMYVGLSSTPVNTSRMIEMHDEAFHYFKGMPEECVYDQAKLVVIHEQFRELELNQQFHTYATTVGFQIKACRGYDPESKGKVEAGVKYVKINGLYGEDFEHWSALEHHVIDWLDTIANQRLHATTLESPQDRYDRDEKSLMKAYLSPAYLSELTPASETRQVDKTGLISWRSNKYSVPMIWQRTRVGVVEEQGQLIITERQSHKEIACHGLNAGKGQVIKNRDHYRDKQQTLNDLEKSIQKHLGDSSPLLCQLLKKTNPAIYKDQLIGLKDLSKKHTIDNILLAYLLDRSSLATSQIKDFIAAYAIHPERFERKEAQPNSDHKILPETHTNKSLENTLNRYADLGQSTSGEQYDAFH